MLDNWTRSRTERFRNKVPTNTASLIDLLAANPGCIFTSGDLVETLNLESERSLSGLLSQVTNAAKRADIDQSEEGSWFVCWKKNSQGKLRYYLTQERADRWNGHTDRNYWALLAKPGIYDIESAIQVDDIDWWATGRDDLKTGDRIIIWKAKGSEKFRGIVALGEVVGPTTLIDDSANPFWRQLEGPEERERVGIKYIRCPNLPFWIGQEHDELLNDLSVSRGQGTAFIVTPKQWEAVLLAAGGWREEGQGISDWSQWELEILVNTYIDILAGDEQDDAEQFFSALPPEIARAKEEVSSMLGMISATLADCGLPTLRVFPAIPHNHSVIERAVVRHANDGPVPIDGDQGGATKNSVSDFEFQFSWKEDLVEEPPNRRAVPPSNEISSKACRPTKVDFLARNRRNKELGEAGERWVLEFEKARLKEADRSDLADNIRWVSKEDGDGLGYDIQSFDAEGEPIYIEVKTTQHGSNTAFLISRNEIERSREHGPAYHLYRVYNFPEKARVFILQGPVSDHCFLQTESYRAIF